MIDRKEVLAPILHPLNGSTQAPGQVGHQEVLGVELATCAEPAAGISLREVDAALVEAEQGGERPPVEVGDFCRAPYGQELRRGVPLGQESASLHRRCGLPPEGESLARRTSPPAARPRRPRARSSTSPPRCPRERASARRGPPGFRRRRGAAGRRTGPRRARVRRRRSRDRPRRRPPPARRRTAPGRQPVAGGKKERAPPSGPGGRVYVWKPPDSA